MNFPHIAHNLLQVICEELGASQLPFWGRGKPLCWSATCSAHLSQGEKGGLSSCGGADRLAAVSNSVASGRGGKGLRSGKKKRGPVPVCCLLVH